MNFIPALSNFTYKVKALFPTRKSQPKARIYEHVPKFEGKARERGSERTSPSSYKKKAKSSPNNENIFHAFANSIASIFTLISGADTETGKEDDTKGSKPSGQENVASTAPKVNQQSSYDVEAGDEPDDQEETKLLQEDEEKEEPDKETKGNTSSMQAGWNISNLIQGKVSRIRKKIALNQPGIHVVIKMF